MPDEDYDYSYDSDDEYLYPDTDVLVNCFGIKDHKALAEQERLITGVKIVELDSLMIPGDYDLAHLCSFHKFIFGDIYPWAGKPRTKSFISKGKSLFCAPEYIVSYAHDLFTKLKSEHCLAGLDKDRFIKRITFFIAEINALHPFREGNGRAQRAYANQLARNAGWELNLRDIDPKELCNAYIESMHVDTEKLEDLLMKHITKQGK
jgi:cell filamentation protein